MECPSYGAMFFENGLFSALPYDDKLLSKLFLVQEGLYDVAVLNKKSLIAPYIQPEFIADLVYAAIYEEDKGELLNRLQESLSFLNFQDYYYYLCEIDEELSILDARKMAVDSEMPQIIEEVSSIFTANAQVISISSEFFKQLKACKDDLQRASKLLTITGNLEKAIARVNAKKTAQKNVLNGCLESLMKLSNLVDESKELSEMMDEMQFQAGLTDRSLKEPSVTLNEFVDAFFDFNGTKAQKVGALLTFLYLRCDSSDCFSEYYDAYLARVAPSDSSDFNLACREIMKDKFLLPRYQTVDFNGNQIQDCNENIIYSLLTIMSEQKEFDRTSWLQILSNIPGVTYRRIVGTTPEFFGCYALMKNIPFMASSEGKSMGMEKILLRCPGMQIKSIQVPKMKSGSLTFLSAPLDNFMATEMNGDFYGFPFVLKKVFPSANFDISLSNPGASIKQFFESYGFQVTALKQNEALMTLMSSGQQFKLKFIKMHGSFSEVVFEDATSIQAKEFLKVYEK